MTHILLKYLFVFEMISGVIAILVFMVWRKRRADKLFYIVPSPEEREQRKKRYHWVVHPLRRAGIFLKGYLQKIGWLHP